MTLTAVLELASLLVCFWHLAQTGYFYSFRMLNPDVRFGCLVSHGDLPTQPVDAPPMCLFGLHALLYTNTVEAVGVDPLTGGGSEAQRPASIAGCIDNP